MENLDSTGKELSRRDYGKQEKKHSELVDNAIRRSIEATTAKLEAMQKESKDDFFKKLNIRGLTPEALMILNIPIEREGKPLPRNVLENAFEIAKDDQIYNDPDAFADPKERLAYIKEIILRYLNTFYKEKEKF
jgi:hypothetical protein